MLNLGSVAMVRRGIRVIGFACALLVGGAAMCQDQPCVPGTYYTIVNKRSGKVFGVQAGSVEDGAPIVQWRSDGTNNQKWTCEPSGDGSFVLRASHSGKVLNVPEASMADGARITQWPLVAGAGNEQWRFVSTGDGYFNIIVKHSGKVLGVAAGSLADGAPIVQWRSDGTDNQQWTFQETAAPVACIPGKYYRVANKGSGKVLGVAAGSVEDGAQIVQWDSDGTNNQKWSCESVPGGYYMLAARHSGKVLNVPEASMADGAGITQWPAVTGAGNEQWQFVPTGDGYYNIVARHSGKVLGVAAGSQERGAPIVQWHSDGTDNQRWNLLEVTLLPYDLVWDAVDDNGLMLNPRWAYQTQNPGSFPDAAQLCGGRPFTPQCTSRAPVEVWGDHDYGVYQEHCGPHENWAAATYTGQIYWEEHSCDLCDSDYNFRFVPDGLAGLQAGDHVEAGCNPQDSLSMEPEFSSNETVDNFRTPFWNILHDAVDEVIYDPFGRPVRTAGRTCGGRPGQLVDGHLAIITGLLGLDCEHGCHTELHPAWALAIRTNDDPSNEEWGIFVRNSGNEGYCGTSQQRLHLANNVYKLRLPWRPGATGVTNPHWDFNCNRDDNCPDIGLAFARDEGVELTFQLDPPGEDGLMYNGLLTLQWRGPEGLSLVEPTPRPAMRVIPRASSTGKTAEQRMSELMQKMTPEQLAVYTKAVPPPTPPKTTKCAVRSAVRVDHLPVKPTLLSPGFDSVPGPKEAAREEQRIKALRQAFGGDIPKVQ